MWKAAFFLFPLALSGCGDLCVGNMGDCERVNKATPPTASSDVEIKAPAARIKVGERMTFTATGGVPPYKYSIVQGGGTIDADSGVYTAPNTVGAVVVRAIDTRMTATATCEKCEIPIQVVNAAL